MDNPSLSQNALEMQQVDEICNALEAAFRSGESPSVEEYLDRANPALHPTLLPELIQLEVHYKGDSSATICRFGFRNLSLNGSVRSH